MNEIRCIIVEDEPIARDILHDYITEVPEFNLVGVFKSGIEAREFLTKNKVDLIFLDINMPRLTGIGLLEAIDSHPMVVITTAYPEYALQGYEYDVIDYLLKPFSLERFLRSVSKIENRRKGHSQPAKTDSMHPSEPMDPQSLNRQLVVRSDKRTWPIELATILFIEAVGDYVCIHTRDRKILVNETMKNIEDALPSRHFLRVHKSWIVSRSAIEYIEGNGIICGKTTLPIGKTYRDKVLQWLQG